MRKQILAAKVIYEIASFDENDRMASRVQREFLVHEANIPDDLMVLLQTHAEQTNEPTS